MLLKQWTHVQLKTCIKYMIIYPTGFPWNEMRVVGKFRGELSKKNAILLLNYLFETKHKYKVVWHFKRLLNFKIFKMSTLWQVKLSCAFDVCMCGGE